MRDQHHNKNMTDKQRLDYLDGICKPLEQGGARMLFVAVGYIPKSGTPPPTNIREAVDMILAQDAEIQDMSDEVARDVSAPNE